MIEVMVTSERWTTKLSHWAAALGVFLVSLKLIGYGIVLIDDGWAKVFDRLRSDFLGVFWLLLFATAICIVLVVLRRAGNRRTNTALKPSDNGTPRAV